MSEFSNSKMKFLFFISKNVNINSIDFFCFKSDETRSIFFKKEENLY